MKKLIIIALLALGSLAASAVGTVIPFEGDQNLLRGVGVVVSGTKYVDKTLATGGSQETQSVAFEDNPFNTWCAGQPIQINTEQVGRITVPLDLSLAQERMRAALYPDLPVGSFSAINVIVRVDAETFACHLQTVSPRN